MPVESPWDHNAECRFCDEQAHHRADCPWLMALEARVAALDDELIKANEKVEAFRESATDFASKLQCLIDWADRQGLLPEHLFTFPDGDTWEATR